MSKKSENNKDLNYEITICKFELFKPSQIKVQIDSNQTKA